MDPAAIIYTSCNLGDAVKILQEVSSKYGYSLWSLRGDPSMLQFSPSAIALRVAVYTEKIRPNQELPEESCVGSSHLVRVGMTRTRISFQAEDLAGEALSRDARLSLRDFVEVFDNMLELKGLRLSDDETGGKTSVLPKIADTGPLPV